MAVKFSEIARLIEMRLEHEARVRASAENTPIVEPIERRLADEFADWLCSEFLGTMD